MPNEEKTEDVQAETSDAAAIEAVKAVQNAYAAREDEQANSEPKPADAPDTSKDEQSSPEPADDPDKDQSGDDGDQMGLTTDEQDAAKFFHLKPDDFASLDEKVRERFVKARSTADRIASQAGRMKQEEAESPKDEDEDEDEPGDEIVELDPDEYGEEVAAIVNGQAKTIREMKARLDDLSQTQELTHKQKAMREFEDFVSGLDSDVFPELGSGKMDDLDPKSPEYFALTELADEAALQFQTLDAAGKNPTIKASLERAVRILYPDAPIKTEQKKLADITSGRNRKRISRPNSNGQNPTKKTGDELAIDAAKNVFAFYHGG